MKEKKMQDMNENRERFLQASREAYPLMNQLKEILVKHGFSDTTYITISVDGYMELRPHETGWALRRHSFEEKPKAVFEYREEISLEEV